jgi:hypothetical protein
MFEMLYSGRAVAFDSPLNAEEVTQRLQQGFDGTFTDGRLHMMRRVRGRNSFRSVIDGQLSRRSAGSHLVLRLRLHPVVLVFGAVFALIAGTVAAIAAPEIPVIGGSPLFVRLLAMGVVVSGFAALGSVEARLATKLVAELVNAEPLRAAAGVSPL